jgi:hypothetical protein
MEQTGNSGLAVLLRLAKLAAKGAAESAISSAGLKVAHLWSTNGATEPALFANEIDNCHADACRIGHLKQRVGPDATLNAAE